MTAPADKLKLQALWDAHREMTSLHNRLRAVRCDATAAKIASALRSVSAAYAAANKRIDRATGSAS